MYHFVNVNFFKLIFFFFVKKFRTFKLYYVILNDKGFSHNQLT